jgi:hypothetical protein
MAKPIVFIKCPRIPGFTQTLGEVRNHINALFDDEYHVLCFPTNEDEMEVQVFNDPNLTEANFDELKQIVENALYELKYPNDEQLPQESSGPGDSSEV